MMQLPESMFCDTIRVWQNTASDYEEPNWTLIKECKASVQENGKGGESDGMVTSDYVAYLRDDRIKASTDCKIDWMGFNREFSDNESDWKRILKPAFNYEGMATVIYFNETGN